MASTVLDNHPTPKGKIIYITDYPVQGYKNNNPTDMTPIDSIKIWDKTTNRTKMEKMWREIASRSSLL